MHNVQTKGNEKNSLFKKQKIPPSNTHILPDKLIAQAISPVILLRYSVSPWPVGPEVLMHPCPSSNQPFGYVQLVPNTSI